MKKLAALLLSAFWSLAGASAFAQDDEIIVTGSRISSYESDTVPVIHLKRRADFMVVEVIVESDSRDAKVRRDEVFKTLSALADRADRDQRIDLGIRRTFETDNDETQVVEPFSRNSIRDEILTGGARTDTSRAIVIAKTPIEGGDTFDIAHARLAAFIKGAAVTGRATVTESDEPGLSIVDIGQYRAPLLALIAADNKAVRSVFGEDYQVSISGLEEPVRWRVTGPLDLAIYFPYRSAVAPN